MPPLVVVLSALVKHVLLPKDMKDWSDESPLSEQNTNECKIVHKKNFFMIPYIQYSLKPRGGRCEI